MQSSFSELTAKEVFLIVIFAGVKKIIFAQLLEVMFVVCNDLVDVVSKIYDVTEVQGSPGSSIVLSRSEIECRVVVVFLNQ